jgi:hypothetical protein
MKTILVLAVLLVPCAALAQPAKDLFDAQQAARQHERDLQPAVQLARETAGVLRLFLQVEGTLGNTQLPAGSALDKAIIQMQDYDRDLARRRALIPQDVRKRMAVGEQMLEHARYLTSADLTLLRDKWHHEFVHQMSRRVAEDAQQIASLIGAYVSIENGLRALQSSQLAVIANSENAAGLPSPTPQP